MIVIGMSYSHISIGQVEKEPTFGVDQWKTQSCLFVVVDGILPLFLCVCGPHRTPPKGVRVRWKKQVVAV